MFRILFILLSILPSVPSPTFAVKGSKIELNHSDVVRCIRSKYKFIRHKGNRYRVKAKIMDGPFADRFLNHPESVCRKVTFEETAESPHLIYQDTEIFYTTPAQEQLVINGLVTLELEELK